MKLKELLIAAALVLSSSAAWGQCTGQSPSGDVCGNSTASQGFPAFVTQSAMLDRAFGAVQGRMLSRGSSVWSGTAAPSLGLNGTAGGSLTLQGSTSGSSAITVQAAAGTATLFQLPNSNGTNNQVLTTDGSGHLTWVSVAGTGTVTSVGLALPGIFTVSGSPVTNTGTLTGTLATQSANLVWAGPTTGAAAAPTFRSLVGADVPNPSASTLGGIQSSVGASHQWISTISTSGVPGLTQPAFTDISGTLAATQCPNPSASTIGCVESYVAVANQWINAISTSGVPSSTQPNFNNLAGSATLSQLPSISNNSVLGNNSGGTAVPSTLSATNVLDFIGTTQGQILYRNASAWVALAPGTSGQVLATGGAAANPAWQTVSGTGTVTSVATNNGITGGAITTTGTIGLATIATGNALAYTGGVSGVPVATTPSTLLDVIGSATGDILYRAAGGTGWTVLAPGTNGQVLTQGASTPAWASSGTLTNVTISAGAGMGTFTGTCNISTTGTCTIVGSGKQLPGTATNDSASSGNVGEYVSSSIPIGSAVSVTNNVAANVTSISLTAGDWDVWGQVNSSITASAQITLTESYVTTTSATRATPPNGGAYVFDQQAKTASTNVSYPVGMTRLSLSGTTTVYLGVFSLFNTSTNAYYGFIGARRVR